MTFESPQDAVSTETVEDISPDTTDSTDTTEQETDTEPMSSQDALNKAFDDLQINDEDTDSTSTEAGSDQQDDGASAGGEDAAGTGDTNGEIPAPSRLSKEAKAAWDKADPAVKAEVNRAISELETGIAQKSEALKPVQKFLDMAAEQKVDPAQVLQGYVEMENQLYADPGKGLAMLGQRMGFSVPQMVQMLSGQSPQPSQNPQAQQGQPDPRDQQIQQLHQEINSMRGQFETTQQSIAAQQAQAQQSQIESFAKDHPRMDELADEIVRQINSGFDLSEAYERAEKLNPLPQVQQSTTPVTAQNRQRKSVTGKPANGSNPKAGKPKSTMAALEQAFAELS